MELKGTLAETTEMTLDSFVPVSMLVLYLEFQCIKLHLCLSH